MGKTASTGTASGAFPLAGTQQAELQCWSQGCSLLQLCGPYSIMFYLFCLSGFNPKLHDYGKRAFLATELKGG